MPSTVFLFTDIEGSSRLWEQQPEPMRQAQAQHDALCRQALQLHRGQLVKSTGDGVHAAFDDALDALLAALWLQRALLDGEPSGLALRVRCGLHLAPAQALQARDGDFYGADVNRAARIMAAAHGGQVLLSQAVADSVAERLPADLGLLPLGAVRLRDLREPLSLYQLLAAPLRREFPPLRQLQATPHNLPRPGRALVGRAAECAQLRQALAVHRLVTLVGSGGIGKTRLSLELGHQLLDEFADGVWLLELEQLNDARLLVQALASTLRLREQPGQALEQTLAEHLRERRLLLILDNCEHLLAGSAAFAQWLLREAPQLVLLASSREAMHLDAEHCVEVPTLALPRWPAAAAGAAALPEPAQALQHAAVQLFVQCAQAADSGFVLGAANLHAVCDICQAVDGLPLAIELAAARVRGLSVHDIAARLAQGFKLLRALDDNRPPRQRTLALLIDWSHGLLADDEKRLYRRLAVFVGGFTLAAAEQVCADAALDAEEVIDLLARLTEKSLLARTEPPQASAATRWRMLESVRRHAATALADAEGEAVALRLRHLRWLHGLASRALPQLSGPQASDWLDQLDRESDNLMGALSWVAHSGAAAAPEACALALDLAYQLRPYWINRGLISLGLHALQALLNSPAACADSAHRVGALFAAGQLCCFAGHYASALGHLQQALAMARDAGLLQQAAMVLQPLGIAAMGLGDMVAARAHFVDALALARQLDDRRQQAAALIAVAQIDRTQGRLDDAQQHYSESLVLARALGLQDYEVVGLLNLTMVALGRQPAQTAEVPALLLQALALIDARQTWPLVIAVLDVCTAWASCLGRHADAARWHGLAEARAEAAGLQRDPADEAFVRPMVLQSARALGDAAWQAAGARGRAEDFASSWQALRAELARQASQSGA